MDMHARIVSDYGYAILVFLNKDGSKQNKTKSFQVSNLAFNIFKHYGMKGIVIF